MLTSGIPGREQYAKVADEAAFTALYDYSRRFGASHAAGGRSSALYGLKWVADPFLQWSRRWEYVYVLQRLQAWRQADPGPADIVDAGSGFTFFPFYLQSIDPECRIMCFDNDPTVGNAMREIADAPVPSFHLEDLEDLSQDDATVDAVYSVSVIEHTANPKRVVDEVRRVLKPGGLFVCTFDVAFEPSSQMSVARVRDLLQHLSRGFESDVEQPAAELDALREGSSSTVTTDWIAQVARDTLPWRYPRLIWLYDALRGRFRSSLYRPMTFYCGCYVKPR